MPTKEPKENPLRSANIPPPPPVSVPTPLAAAERGNGNMNNTVINPPAAPRVTTKKPVDELATVELSLYLRPAQDDKLEDLRRAYKRRTGKKISANEVMRRLIERATLENLL